MERNEWDEEVEKVKKFAFGDEVITPNGDYGKICELDGEEYRVFNNAELGWFRADELTHA